MNVFRFLGYWMFLMIICSRPVFSMGDLRMMQQDTLTGKSVLDFTLMKTDGTKSSLNETRGGKKAVLFFWATWCPHCREEIQVLAKRAEEFKAQHIEIILVDIGENKSNVAAYLSGNKIPWNSFLDTEEEVSGQYRIMGVPTLIFVSEDGMVKTVRHDLPENLNESF